MQAYGIKLYPHTLLHSAYCVHSTMCLLCRWPVCCVVLMLGWQFEGWA
jgi:hypothetical protein